MGTALKRLVNSQPREEQADGLFVFLASPGTVLRERPKLRPVFLEAFDKAIQFQFANHSHEFSSGTDKFVDLLRQVLEDVMSEMDMYQLPPH